jgi:hypothetical protein
MFSLFFILAGHPSFGIDSTIGKIADDSALRTNVKDSWLTETPARVLAKPRALLNLSGGGSVEVRAEAGQDGFMVIFAREHPDRPGYFPGWAQGSWVFIRQRDTGAVTRIRVFLRSDMYTYVQFRPFSADKCQMDVVLYDAYIVQSLPLPVPLERLYTMSLTEIVNLAGSKFPQKYFDPNPDDYRDQRLFIARVREQLPQLEFADDGAIDQEGRYVYINGGLEQNGQPGLNCSGFAKWLIDGILRPYTGERMAIPPLKAPFGERGSSHTALWEEIRDPFFGLDWIRNLASQAGTALYSSAFGSLKEIEVRREPFSQIIIRSGSRSTVKSYPGFLENAGYGIEGLLPLLYTLAIDEPGKFFLAAVNTEGGPPVSEDNPRGTPRMRQYFHIAALIPFFDENGAFQVVVFESATETSSIIAFRNRYPNHHVSLVRVPVETRFEP